MSEEQPPQEPRSVSTEVVAPASAESGQGRLGERRRLRRERSQSEAESLAQRLFSQWSALRDERERQLAPPQVAANGAATSAPVPAGYDLAAAWAWRFLVIVAALAVVGWVLGYLVVIVVPVVVSLLITALAVPLVDRVAAWGVPRGLAALVTVVLGIGFVVALLTFVGQQVAGGASDLADSTVAGLGEIRQWLQEGPLNATDSQIDGYIDQAQRAITERSDEGEILARLSEVGTTLTHVFAGFFIVLFSTYFFMADGSRIWSWIVRLAPRTARARFDSSGRVAWISLRQFVRATVIVALVDAVGIAVWAAVMGLPFVLAILRYAITVDRGVAEAPETAALGDRVLVVLGGVWLILFGLGAVGA